MRAYFLAKTSHFEVGAFLCSGLHFYTTPFFLNNPVIIPIKSSQLLPLTTKPPNIVCASDRLKNSFKPKKKKEKKCQKRSCADGDGSKAHTKWLMV